MNGAVGYQLVDDGTPLSLGLIFGSAALLFVGTGYIALDTGFSWTGFWNDTITNPDRSYSLYTLYQLVPLVFLVVYFLLEVVLVLRVLGEKKPMRTFTCPFLYQRLLTLSSVPPSGWSALCHRTGLPIRCQRIHMYGHESQDQRRTFRNALHSALCRDDLDLLVEHHRRRLASTHFDGQHLHMSFVKPVQSNRLAIR